MKSKLKRTHHHHPQSNPIRPHANTFSLLPLRQNSNDQERRISEYAAKNNEYRFSTPPSRNYSLSIQPSLRRSLKHYPKYSTQSTTESETTQGDQPVLTSIQVLADDDELAKTKIDSSDQSPLISS